MTDAMMKTEPDQTALDAERPSRRRKAAESVTEVTRKVRETADQAVHAASATFDSRPFSAIGGALAVGAVAAALLPTTEREEELLGPVAQRVRASIDDAVASAKEAGVGELSAAGLTFAAASNGLGGVVGSIAKAALAAGGAAATSVKSPRRTISQTPAAVSAPADAPVDDLPPVAAQ